MGACPTRRPGLKSRATETKPAGSRLHTAHSPSGLRFGSWRLQPPGRRRRGPAVSFRTVGAIPLLFSVLLAGCGYHFAGEPIGLPGDVHSVSVGLIENRSREHGLEKTLQFALEREVYIRRHYQMDEDPAG